MPNSDAFVVIGHCYVAVYVMVTIFLAVLTVKVRNRTKRHNIDDKIVRGITKWVLPLLVVHALGKLSIDVVQSARLPLGSVNYEAVYLSDVIISGFTYAPVIYHLLRITTQKPPAEAETGKPVQSIQIYATMPPQSPMPVQHHLPQQYMPPPQNIPHQYMPAQQNVPQYYHPQQNVPHHYMPPHQNTPQYTGGPGYPGQA